MKKRYISLISIALFSTCLLGGLILAKKAQKSPFQGSKLTQELFKERKEAHDAALAQIKTDFAIADDKWTEFMGNCALNIENDNLLGASSQPTVNSSDEPVITMIKNILREYGINPERVTIALVNSSDTPAQAIQTLSDDNQVIHKIEIDLHRINKYEPAVQEALLRHEIMHLLHYDSLEGSYVITMLYQLGYSRQECEKHLAMIAYRHQRELRADLLASCDHPEVAQSLQRYFEGFIKMANQDNPALWTSHPSDQVRHTQLANLLTTMGVQTSATLA